MLSPFAPQGSRATTVKKKKKKHNRKSPTDPAIFPVQAKPDVLPLSLSPSCFSLFQPLPLPPSSFYFISFFPSPPSFSLLSMLPPALPLSRGGCVTESLGPQSHGGDSFNQLHMCSALIGWPSAISPDLKANHRAPQWVSQHASHHRILVFSYLFSPHDLMQLNVWPICFKEENNDTARIP